MFLRDGTAEFRIVDNRLNPDRPGGMSPFELIKNGLFRYGGEERFLTYQNVQGGVMAEIELTDHLIDDVQNSNKFLRRKKKKNLQYRYIVSF